MKPHPALIEENALQVEKVAWIIHDGKYVRTSIPVFQSQLQLKNHLAGAFILWVLSPKLPAKKLSMQLMLMKSSLKKIKSTFPSMLKPSIHKGILHYYYSFDELCGRNAVQLKCIYKKVFIKNESIKQMYL